MRYFIFNTGGDWDSTTLFLNGEEFLASKLFVDLQTGRDEFGNLVRGGLANGGQMQAYVVPQDDGAPEQAMFPGRIDFEFPTHRITIENESPMFAIEMTSVILDGQDVSNEVTEIQINIDAVNNEVSAYLTLYRPHVFAADEVATYTLL
jgi:hypothetical protein